MIEEGLEERSSLLHALAYETRVSDVMITDIIATAPEDKMSELMEILRSTRISGTPVLDGDRLAGIISIEDLIRCLVAGGIDDPVEKWMTRTITTLDPDEHLATAIGRFNTLGFGRFPVVSRQTGRLMGVITKGAIIRGLLKKLESKFLQEELHRYRASHIFEDIVANEITLNLKYDVEGQNLKKAGESSGNFKRTLMRLGIAPPIVRRIAIASYEAEMNIVVFTDGGRLIATIGRDRIGVTAEDKGPGIPDVEKALTPGWSTAPDWVRALGFGAGMGLCNIKKNSDEMNLYSEVGKGTILEFVVALPQNGAVRN